MKFCPKCSTTKENNEFHRSKRKSDGLFGHCKVCVKAVSAAWYARNRRKANAYSKKWRSTHKERVKETFRFWRKSIPEEKKEQRREGVRLWGKSNRNHTNQYIQKRRRTDPCYKLAASLRGRLRKVLKGQTKTSSALELLGCPVDKARLHIEQQFQPGMIWENWTSKGWNLDHIKPLASFDLTDPAQQRVAFHYTNLQPLWWMENEKKGSRV